MYTPYDYLKKVELLEKVKELDNIIREIGKWAFPQQYEINELTPKRRLIFHMEGIRKEISEKFYKEDPNEND